MKKIISNGLKTKQILKDISFAIIVILITFSITKAGDLFPAGTSVLPTFYTLGDIYTKLTDNTSSADEADHNLSSSAIPASTFYTLKQVYEAIPTLDADKMLTTADYMGVTGTIVNRGAVTITPSTVAQTITAGYHNGSGTVVGDTDLSSGNILSGVDIFGVEGAYYTTNLIPANVKNGTEFGDGETGTMSPSQTLKTGQTTCYDVAGKPISCTGTGQDGEYQKGQARSYTATANTVTDNSTGLMWKKCSERLSGDDCETGHATTMTWTTATSTCENDTTAGYTDWRLPNIKELLSIVDYGKISPAIDTDVFPATVSGVYWSSTAYLDGPRGAWGVSFHGGYAGVDGKDGENYVRCVR